MNSKKVDGIWAIGRVLWSTSITCVAMGLVIACGAHPEDGEGAESPEGNAQTVEKAAFLDGVIAACEGDQNCETREVCVNDIRPCVPPILVNGRNIDCIVQVCTQQRVCTPCGAEEVLSPGLESPVLDIDIDDFPFDPSPLSR